MAKPVQNKTSAASINRIVLGRLRWDSGPYSESFLTLLVTLESVRNMHTKIDHSIPFKLTNSLSFCICSLHFARLQRSLQMTVNTGLRAAFTRLCNAPAKLTNGKEHAQKDSLFYHW